MPVVAGSASKPFAEALAGLLRDTLVRTEGRRFPDGEFHARILDDLRGRDCVVVQNTAPDTDFVEMLLWLDAAREAGARHVTAVVPYYGYARQDRSFAPGEAISSRALGKALGAACDRLITVDPHKPEILGFAGKHATYVSAVPQLAAQLKAWGVDTVLAPDKGARDRAEAAANLIGCPFDHLEKTRLSATEVVMKTKSLDVRGKRVAIVDDLIASGGTMLTAAKQLKEQGATSVVAACTHGLFTGNALPRLLSGGIDRVLCTDTWFPTGCNCEHVSAAGAVAQALQVRLA